MMKAFRFISIIGFLPLFVFAGVSVAFSQDNKETKPVETTQTTTQTVQPVLTNKPTERYRIGLQDVLDIVISRHPELSLGNVRMDNEGRIRLPRIDAPITAVCKTETELANEIMDQYRKNYLRDPFVTVFVREQNSQPLAVMGAVQKPGNFMTNRRLTLLELISYAGGPDVEFAGTKIQVARVGGISGCTVKDENAEKTEGDITFFSYKLVDVVSGKTNPIMRPGDIVYVEKADQVYVTGNVVKPQPITLIENLTLTQAIAATGGMLPATKKSQVTLIRQEPGSAAKQEFTYSLNDIKEKKIPDPVLQANDIIFVPTDKVKTFMTGFIEAITGGLGNVFYRIP